MQVEAKLKGMPMPEHVTKDEPGTPCPYCTAVARRAVTIRLDASEEVKN